MDDSAESAATDESSNDNWDAGSVRFSTPTPRSRTGALRCLNVASSNAVATSTIRASPSNDTGGVLCRVSVVKSSYRSFRVTLRACLPARRSRRPTFSARFAIVLSRNTRSVESSGKVVSAEIDFASPSVATSELSIPFARSINRSDWLPISRRSGPSLNVASCPRVCIPSRPSFSAARGPMPGSLRTGIGARYDASSPGGTVNMPSGLRSAEAILATSREGAMPIDAVSFNSLRTRSLMSDATFSAGPCSFSVPVMSMYASSTLITCTSGV